MTRNGGTAQPTASGAVSRRAVPAATAATKQATPAPFSAVPAESKMNEFLKHLDNSLVYITHLDTHPRAFKRRLFMAPTALNIAIALGLLWRVYKAYPFYVDLLLLVLGYETNARVDVATKTRRQLISIIVRRGLTLFVDFLLIRFVSLWPLTFLLQAPASPVRWRWNVGFADTEVIVRESQGWGQKDLLKGLSQGSDSPFFKTRILPALDKNLLREKSGYLLIRPDWGLSFHGMIHATNLVTRCELSFDDFKKSVYVYSEEHGWIYWDVHELDKDSEEESRRKIVLFKDRLTAMGKESLFFRWVELIQFESTQPGGFTHERQQAAVQKAKKLFQDQGVDFEEFVESIGGVETLPGMEHAS